jgi:hypothetical protein
MSDLFEVPDGYFTAGSSAVRRVVPTSRIDNPVGVDMLRFRATHAGEVCVVPLSI